MSTQVRKSCIGCMLVDHYTFLFDFTSVPRAWDPSFRASSTTTYRTRQPASVTYSTILLFHFCAMEQMDGDELDRHMMVWSACYRDRGPVEKSWGRKNIRASESIESPIVIYDLADRGETTSAPGGISKSNRGCVFCRFNS
jgi:hypothetical protein